MVCAAAVIFAHTMATSPEGVNAVSAAAAAARAEEKKGIRSRIPKFFPNRAERRRDSDADDGATVGRREKCIESHF